MSPRTVVTRLAPVLLGWLAAPVHAQDARLIASGPPSAELPYEFTKVAQVYELRDGRVLVLDQADAIVRLANIATGVSTVIGRTGSGPGEYRLPLYLVPLGGDSVGVYDDAAVRFLVVNADGEVSGFAPVVAQGDGARVGGFVGDGRGWLYGELRSRPMTSDSARLFRWRVGETNAQFVGTIARPLPEGAISVGGGAVRPGSFARPDTRNMWTVDGSGRLAIAVFRPYYVEFISASGQRVVGKPIPHRALAMNDSVKQAFLAERAMAAVSGMVTDGKTGKTSAISGVSMPLDASSITWAAEVPPFRGNAFVAFAPDGKLWIQRTTFGREGARYDLIGPDGALADRVRLPDGHRVVGFGRDAIYVIRRDADDLEFLQRRPLIR